MDSTLCLLKDSNSKMAKCKFVVDHFSNRKGDEPVEFRKLITVPDVAQFELIFYPNKRREISNCSMINMRNYIHPSQAYGTSDKTVFRCEISFLNKSNEKCYTKAGQFVIEDKKIESAWSFIISRDYLRNPANGLLSNDTLTIECEISVMDQLENQSLEIMQYKYNTMRGDFKSLFDSKKGSDVVLVSGETEFSAHKLILSARSPVFSAMFEHNLEEKKQNRVEITDIKAKVLGKLLKYIYTGTLSSLEKYSDKLLIAADKYQIDSLKSICEESLSLGLTIESAMKLLVLSEMHNATKLKANCLNYISNHSSEVTDELYNSVIAARPELGLKLYNALAINYGQK